MKIYTNIVEITYKKQNAIALQTEEVFKDTEANTLNNP